MKVTDYLVQSLVNLGVTEFFGLPGDYNFNVLYSIEDNDKSKWIGCINELNAGYAADGYARTKGYGAVVTTFGVGELSAMNAVAGSFAENIPVMSIVGVPTTKDIETNRLIHHNFQTPDYYAFQKAFEPIVETTAYLTKENAKEEIDRIINVMVKTKRPVYVAIPVDVCLFEIEDTIVSYEQSSDINVLESFVKDALELINNSNKPLIIADSLIKRYQAESEFHDFLNASKIPVTNFLMGSGIVDSNYDQYIGSYLAAFGHEYVNSYLESTDCAISVGPIYSDLNSFGFAWSHTPDDFIAIYGTYSVIKNKKYDNILMGDVLDSLSKNVKAFDVKLPNDVDDTGYPKSEIKDNKLAAKYIYPRLQEFFKPNDLLFMETGIIPHGFVGIKLPPNVIVNTQTLWGSIGWATPATLGGCIAEPNRRTILFTGEGSHQLTATEISNMMRRGVKPIIIVLNNSGYTIERVLSDDPWDEFNEIAEWNYSKLPEIFAGDVWIAQAHTDKEFDTVLKLAELQDKMCYIEIFAEKMDLPVITEKTIEHLKSKK